jgi:hypothetical protein
MNVMRVLGSMCAFALLIGLSARANAGLIGYDYKTTLALTSGSDTLGLNGATIEVKVDVSSTAVYATRFGFPEVPMNNDATVTVTGASVAANNGTFSLPQLSFYPTFAGLFTEPGGAGAVETFPVGGSLTLQINTVPTAHGSLAHVGDTVNILDFAPATSQNLTLTGTNGSYSQNNTMVTAALINSPEPLTLAHAGTASAVGLAFGWSRYRRRRAAA